MSGADRRTHIERINPERAPSLAEAPTFPEDDAATLAAVAAEFAEPADHSGGPDMAEVDALRAEAAVASPAEVTHAELDALIAGLAASPIASQPDKPKKPAKS